MGLKGLVFDKDGTLIDFDLTWGPAFDAVMRHLARGDGERLARLMAVSHYVAEEKRFLPSSPLVAGSTDAFAPAWADILGRAPDLAFRTEVDALLARHGLDSLTPIGAPAALFARLAARGVALGVATNDSEASARAQAAALGIAGHCPFVAGYDSGWGAKPEPGMVAAFVAATGLAPREVALVGDSLHDLHAARAAGVVAIAVLSGPRRAAARAEVEPHADHVVDSIEALEALLDAL
ncbi:HAD family hydrolase [Salinarimonas sp.]|uniref:HAD family hydrolase n=1 Tax=Salinarimonas sp. TaxID=2766526 RepID=UPI0032D8FA78